MVSRKTSKKKVTKSSKRAQKKTAKSPPDSSRTSKPPSPSRKTKTAAALSRKTQTSKATKPAGRPQPPKAAGGAPDPRAKTGSIPVVGIGASAGGLEAFTEVLKNLPDDTGMAFVLISHLGDSSLLSELLGRTTRMPVRQVDRKTPVEPNHVYVIPPRKYLTVKNGALTSRPIASGRRPAMVIDHFLLSLAEDQQDRAIGVILSGTGSDGTLGLAAVRARGGIAFVQEPRSAVYPDMPRHAASDANSSDFVLRPAKIAAELARMAHHPSLRGPAPALPGARPPDAPGLSPLFELLQATTGMDFHEYKPATIERRVSRRMLLHNVHALSDYLDYIRRNPEEIEALYQDILITVTGFFRDPRTYDFLSRKIISGIVKGRDPHTPIRIWVPACATGEETYSIAICLLEEMGKMRSGAPVQIFATDVSEMAIRKAREGRYPSGIRDQVTPERLGRFFVEIDGFYQVKQGIRDLCVFAVQNVVKDPPFSKMDLISCRNLLIYLGQGLQQRALTAFHYALKPGGILMLGSSETVSATPELFEQPDNKIRIFRKLETSRRPIFDLEPARGSKAGSMSSPTQAVSAGPNLGREFDRILVDQYAPPAVLLDSRFEILQLRGDTRLFLQPAPGRASLNILRMARESLVGDLKTALLESRSKGKLIRKQGIVFDSEAGGRTVSFEVIPLGKQGPAQRHYLLVFKTATAPPQSLQTGKRKRAVSAPGLEIESLQQELLSTRADLQSMITDMEQTNEDLQSANEEVLSANEELQSTNEELETSKEELQATNEELTTVNEELNNRNVDLDTVNNDLINLLASVNVIIVMIGNDLSIRRYTPNAERIMHLIPSDIGRPLTDIRTRLEVPDLDSRVMRVMRDMAAEEQEVQDSDRRWYSMRIRPYRTIDNRIDGAVLTLVDIDDLKRNRDLLHESESALRLLVDDLPDFILRAEPLGQVLFINRNVASLAPAFVVGESFFDLLDSGDVKTARRCMQDVISSRDAGEFPASGIAFKKKGTKQVNHILPIIAGGTVMALAVKTRASGS